MDRNLGSVPFFPTGYATPFAIIPPVRELQEQPIEASTRLPMLGNSMFTHGGRKNLLQHVLDVQQPEPGREITRTQ